MKKLFKRSLLGHLIFWCKAEQMHKKIHELAEQENYDEMADLCIAYVKMHVDYYS